MLGSEVTTLPASDWSSGADCKPGSEGHSNIVENFNFSHVSFYNIFRPDLIGVSFQ